MSILSIGTKGVEVTLTLRQGMDVGPFSVLLRNPDGTAVDMSGGSVRGHIRKTVDATDFTPLAVTIIGSSTVSFTFGLAAADSDELVLGSSVSAMTANYVWDLEWRDAAGKTRPVFYGTVESWKRRTRD